MRRSRLIRQPQSLPAAAPQGYVFRLGAYYRAARSAGC